MPDRRETLLWLLRALALSAAPGMAIGSLNAEPRVIGGTAGAAGPPAAIHGIDADGYGRDPDLRHPRVTWPLTLEPEQKTAVAALADALLPAEEGSPAASALGVPDFLDEWISAPYPQQRTDREVILAGLTWIHSQTAHAHLSAASAEAVVARLSALAAAGREPQAHFFSRLRNICLIGYYTSMSGVAQLGYVGYQPSATFKGPPPEVLALLGV